jgi:predicted nucleic acid-binding Zn ribbon protein
LIEIIAMPIYDYFCPTNNKQVEVSHSINQDVTTWGELCKLAKCEIGDTPEDAKVRRMLSAPRLITPTSNNDYKNAGFTKYVKREEGVYEDVTADSSKNRLVNREGKAIKE